MFEQKRIIQLVKENITGIDDFTVIPLIDLRPALKETISRINRGLVPETYNWTAEKTEYAYNYKNYKKWAKSIFLAAKYYYTDEGGNKSEASKCYGKIARYTWRNNYQYIIDKFKEIVNLLETKLNTKFRYKAISNYTSIPEKILFNWSGLGNIGKNSVLIHSKMGSYFVIGEMFTDLDIYFGDIKKLKAPDFSICGNCSKCMDACPTNAIIENGKLNINRCLQYISENLILVEDEIREKWGNRLYGCSTCLDVCPYNQKLTPSAERHRIGFVGSGFNLIEVLRMNEKDWDRAFSNNQIGRRERLAIIKNAILAIGSLKCREGQTILYELLDHKNEIIRAYAVWALGRIEKNNLKDKLRLLIKKENGLLVKKEIEKAIN